MTALTASPQSRARPPPSAPRRVAAAARVRRGCGRCRPGARGHDDLSAAAAKRDRGRARPDRDGDARERRGRWACRSSSASGATGSGPPGGAPSSRRWHRQARAGSSPIALGSSSSYLVLALAGGVVYVGLNAVTTIHRALVPERFDAPDRPRATSAQELALLVGGLAGLAVGGALTEVATWAPFALAAVLLPLLRCRRFGRVTSDRGRAAEGARASPRRTTCRPRPAPASARSCSRRSSGCSGTRPCRPSSCSTRRRSSASVPPPPRSGSPLSGSRPPPRSSPPGASEPSAPAAAAARRVALMGGGFLGVAASTPRLAVGAARCSRRRGLRARLDARLPALLGADPGRRGGRLHARSTSPSARSRRRSRCRPPAGSSPQRAATARSSCSAGSRRSPRPPARAAIRSRAGAVDDRARLLAPSPRSGSLVAHTDVHEPDEWLFRAINGLGPAPQLLWTTLDPHTRNYLVLIVLAVGAAAVTSPRRIPGSSRRSWRRRRRVGAARGGLFRLRPRRPEEVLERRQIASRATRWGHLNSFPSGHMAITAALAVGIALAFRRRATSLGVRRCRRVHPRPLRRPLPARHRRRDGARPASALIVAAALDRAQRRRGRGTPVRDDLAPLDPADVAVVMPSYDDVPTRALQRCRRSAASSSSTTDRGRRSRANSTGLAADLGAELVRLPERSGKGSAIKAGAARASAFEASWS